MIVSLRAFKATHILFEHQSPNLYTLVKGDIPDLLTAVSLLRFYIDRINRTLLMITSRKQKVFDY